MDSLTYDRKVTETLVYIMRERRRLRWNEVMREMEIHRFSGPKVRKYASENMSHFHPKILMILQ